MDKNLREILEIFESISAIPRCSGNEKNIASWIEAWAERRRLNVISDPAGNVVIKIPATKGFESAPGIVFQGHLDMVCEKIRDSAHDFSKDPIRLIQDGDWLTADGTTLGADNGIGIALCLSLADDGSLPHPPLELLFTVEEETGLTGAESLQPGFIDGNVFINIDSEEEGIFTVGSAGGRTLSIDRPVSTGLLPEAFRVYRLQVHGLRGGHSGVDIDKRRGNANKILAGALNALRVTADLSLLSMTGGTRSNAIPRDAEAVIAFDPARLQAFQTVISDFERTVRREYALAESSLSIALSEAASEDFPGLALSPKDFDTVLRLLSAFPDGVVEMSSDIEGLVETSNNLATVTLTEKSVSILCFMRSSVMAKLDALTSEIEKLSVQAGGSVRNDGEFPPWEPNMRSPLLAKCRQVYSDLYGAPPQVSVIHAGLECGIIGSRYPGLDMISLGPDIENPHSPDERLFIPSVVKIREFLVALLGAYGPM